MKVVAITLENLVRFNTDFNIQVACRTAVGAGLTFALQTHTLTGVDTGRNLHFKRLHDFLEARTVAVRARIRNHRTGSMAVGARLLNREKALFGINDAGTVTVWTSRRFSFGAAARSITNITFFPNRNTDFRRIALGRLLKRNFKVVAQVHTLGGSRTALLTASTHTLAEKFAENVAQVTHIAETARETFRAKTTETAGTTGSAVYAGFTKSVISGTLLFISQNLVGFTNFLKLRLGLFIPIVAVGVILHGQTTISFFNFGCACAFIYTQYFVIVTIAHYFSILAIK